MAKTKKKGTGRRAAPSDQPECYRVTFHGPLKIALEAAHERMQKSRKYRRLASGDIHALAREAVDLGLQAIEGELDEELGSQD
jgi:hypothetical protein